MSPTTTSTRWCPTPEQLMILEEMYKGGMRTPNAAQIQQITAHLSYYGKIEGKNVFYWFQNHKARDRQKLRKKQLSNKPQLPPSPLPLLPPPPPPPPTQPSVPPPYNNHLLLLHQQKNLLIDYLRTPPVLPTSSLLFHEHHHHPHPYFNGPGSSLINNNMTFLPQGTLGMEIAGSRQMMKSTCCKCKLNDIDDDDDHYQGRHHDDVSGERYLEMRMGTTTYGGDLMGPNIMSSSSSCTCCSNRRPLKTLELFPITSTGFKEDHPTKICTSTSSFSSSSN